MPEPKTKIWVTIETGPEHFDGKDQRFMQHAIAGFLEISPNNVRIISVEKGSVRIIIELPTESAERLLHAYERKDPELAKYLAPLVLLDLHRETIKPEQIGYGEWRDGEVLALDYARLIDELCVAKDEKEVLDFVHRHRMQLDDDFLEYLRRATFGTGLEGPADKIKIFYLTVLLTTLGVYEFEQKNFQQACVFYERAAELAKAPDYSVPRGHILHDWGLCCFRLGNYTEAIKIWEEAIAIFKEKELITASHPEFYVHGTSKKISWIEILRFIGTAYEALKQPEKTISYWQQAMQISKEAGLEDPQGWIATDFGNLFRKLWRFEDALSYDYRALEFHHWKGNQEQEGFRLSFIGLDYSYIGPVTKAIEFYKKALAIDKLPKDDTSEKRNRLGNLARVYALSGDKETALKFFRLARRIKTGGKTQDDEALVLINASIGNVYRELCQLENAKQTYMEALRLARNTKNKKMENRLLSSLGIVYRDLDELELAYTHFLSSLLVARAAKDELGRGDALGNLGNILYQKGKPDEAEPYYCKALTIATKMQDTLFISRWRGNLANVYVALAYKGARQKNRLEEAEKWYHEALALATFHHDLDHLYLWNYNLGSLYLKIYKQLPEAHNYYKDAIGALETMRRSIRRDDFSRSFGESKVFVYQDMVNTCLGMPTHQAEAIDFAERGKGYTLMRMMAEANLQPSKKVPSELREEFIDLKKEQFFLETQLANLSSPEDRIAPKAPDVRQKLIADWGRVYEEQIKNFQEIAKRDPEFAEIFNPRPVTIRDIQQHLTQYEKKTKTALVEFFVTGEQTNVFIADSKDWCVVEIPQFTESSLRQFLDKYWLNPYQQYLEGHASPSDWINNMKQVAALWQPVQKELDRIKPARLILVPHLGLHLLPLHLIPFATKQENPATSQQADDYLLDHYEIVYAPSFRMQTYCRNKDRTNRPQKSLFAISNPDCSLNFAEIETACISYLFDDFHVLYHEKASRQAIFDAADRYNFIHFATHGRGATLSHDPLEAGLKIANNELSNQFLTVKEIFKEVKLSQSCAVVLSACETGMIKLDLGDEYIGLPAAFLYAGAPTVVSSLWSVNDISTTLLMSRWYENVLRNKNKMGRCAALMEAQKWLRDLTVGDIIIELQKIAKYVDSMIKTAKSEKEAETFISQQNNIAKAIKDYEELYAHYCPFNDPYFWGGFIISGNPE